MSRTLLISLLTGSVLLSACGGNKAEDTGKAMAESACLLFGEVSKEDNEDLKAKTYEIMEKYGYSDPKEIDTYLSEIRGTEDLNVVTETARTHLEATCGDDLEASGVSAADLAEAMVSE
jgi:hypothetical protein